MDQQGLANSSIQVLGEKQQALTIRTKTLNVEPTCPTQRCLSEKIGAFDPKAVQIDTVGLP
jgi:preprotein translocase subunit SecF